MSNRNFDYRVIIDRLQSINIAQNIYKYQQSGNTIISNPQTSNASIQRITEYREGVQELISKNLGAGYTVNPSGILNIVIASNTPTNNGPIFVVPGVPIINSIIPGNDELVVNFSPPSSDGGSPITDYEYSTDNGVSFLSAGTVDSPFTILGLTNGTSYDVILRAVNSVGFGANSDPVSGTPSTVPSAPTITSITPGNQQLTVNFTSGSDGGSPIINYLATAGPLNITNSNSPIILTGLDNGTTYNVIVRAININGISQISNIVPGTPSTVPSAPTITTITPGNTQLTIDFTEGSDGGSSITNYKYSLNGGAFTVFSPADIISPVIITGLTNGISYSVLLRAVNVIGDSISSNSVSGTPSTVPSAPTSLSALPGNQQATISFTAGSNGGSSIINYKYSTDNGSTFRDFSPADTSSPVIITTLSSDGTTLLTNGTTYSIQLKAINANGDSDASSTVTVTPGLIDQIQASLTTSLTAYNAAANDDWVSITSTEWTSLRNNITGTVTAGATDLIMNMTTNLGSGLTNSASSAIVTNTVESPRSSGIPANSYIYGFSVKFASNLGTSFGVFANNNINSNTGFNQQGNLIQNLINGTNYFVLKGVTSTNGTSTGLIAFFTGTKRDYPNSSFPGSAAYVRFIGDNNTANPLMRWNFFNDSSIPNSSTVLGGSLNNYGTFCIQALTTTTKQWE